MTASKTSTQTDFGRAYEWAVASSIHRQTGAPITPSRFSSIAERSYNKMDEKRKHSFTALADLAMKHILEKKHLLTVSSQDKKITFNADSAGTEGDSRDVLLHIGDRVLGISCKHNHQALKHSRLSGTCNFIKVWGIDASGCSADYWDKVKPLFDKLANLKKDNKHMRWDEVSDKANEYYWPVLNAWASEIKSLCGKSTQKEAEISKSIIAYLVGKHDFYKVMCDGPKRVSIQGFNFNNTLTTKKTKYPDSLIAINNKNGGQYSKTIVFNHGYSINFRIHSASSKVEPSLKFDINAISFPMDEVYQQTFTIEN